LKTTLIHFYICGSVHCNSRLKKSNQMQQYADMYLLLNYSTCFGRPSLPSSGVHKTVVAASTTAIWGASFLKRDTQRRHATQDMQLLNFMQALISEAVDRILVIQTKVRLRTVASAVMNLRLRYKTESFFVSCGIVSFFKRAQTLC